MLIHWLLIWFNNLVWDEHYTDEWWCAANGYSFSLFHCHFHSHTAHLLLFFSLFLHSSLSLYFQLISSPLLSLTTLESSWPRETKGAVWSSFRGNLRYLHMRTTPTLTHLHSCSTFRYNIFHLSCEGSNECTWFPSSYTLYWLINTWCPCCVRECVIIAVRSPCQAVSD